VSKIPEWLERAIEEARDEGRILHETAPVALPFPGNASTPGVIPMPSVDLHKTRKADTRRRVGSVREKEFQLQVIEYAQARRWRVAHFRAVRVQRSSGECYYETPVAADGKGFPDLIIVRGDRLLAAELKVPGNDTSEEQDRWLAAFRGAGVPTFVWYPEHWPAIEEVLK
jgi:hypothetical protein